MEENKTVFKTCRSFNAYEVSLDGRVRVRKTGKELIVKKYPNGIKYVRFAIGLYTGKKKKPRKVSIGELVARTFLRARKDHEILHCINGDWNDYSIDNWEWYDPQKLPENCTKQWKIIADTHSHYDISEDGEVRSHKYCKPLKVYAHKGKPYVTLSVDGKPYIKSVAVLVAAAFLPNPNKHKIVGHKDGNVWNNSVNNLVWGVRDNPTVNHKLNNAKQVDEYSLTGEFIQTWKSLSMAARSSCLSVVSIKNACIGKYKTAGHRVWRFHGEAFDSHKVPVVPELYPDEVFVPIPGSRAEVSNYGRVRNTLNSGQFYKVNNQGSIKITIDGKITTKRPYILEAQLMLPNPHRLKRVGFIDGNPNNQRLENLRWE